MKPPLVSRRRFLQQSLLGAAACAVDVRGLGAATDGDLPIALVTSAEDEVVGGAAPQWAIGELRAALAALGRVPLAVPAFSHVPAGTAAIVVASAGSPLARELAERAAVALPAVPEALLLVQVALASGGSATLACGSDERGLVYAVLELADRVRETGQARSAIDIGRAVSERPASPVRSICRSFTSEPMDKPWFRSRTFWREYLSMLAANRFNRFHLAFGIGYNSTPSGSHPETYLSLAYPFLVSVPGFPEVRAAGLPARERETNLEMLAFVADECARRGMDFHLGLWSHAYAYAPGADYPILGLSEDTHAPYCRAGLAAVLRACPNVTGLTFRVHSESGIPTGRYDFWRTLFEGIRLSGRRVDIDMHGKECTQQHVDLAAATGMKVSVSPKYLAEHEGLPYHPAALRESERKAHADPSVLDGQASRYGYSNFMKEHRNYGVLHRIWPGTQRLLLWADPVFAAGYGRAASFCGSEGVEWMEPLTFRGRQGTGTADGRCGYLDAALEPKWDFEKYALGYRVWGRRIYDPECDADVWRRPLRREFGPAAEAAEAALAHASRILPLVTMYHGVGVDNQAYWPEIYTNVPIVGGRMGAVSSFDPQFFLSPDEYADGALRGADLAVAKYSPADVAGWLEAFARVATERLAAARTAVSAPDSAAFRRLDADVVILSGLGRFFAGKIRSAALWSVYQRSADPAAKAAAIGHYSASRQAWGELAAAAMRVYRPDLAFGSRSAIRGHWADRLPRIDADLADMKRTVVAVEPGHTGSAGRATQGALLAPSRPIVEYDHSAPASFVTGRELRLRLVLRGRGTTEVTLHYRHVNEAESWRTAPMGLSDGADVAVIPADYTRTDYPLQYYFTVKPAGAQAVLIPGLDATLANQPYFVLRQATIW